eukprot:TRINITY_DN5155_c1_g6_i1.p1 TRINITY_DN5155_c1_g6~~TRINITY_DN5155_c1_g6_i1.p1  ORF type:complete len:444 (-),score=118.01 TRINITY_DN5155_c1_g6_i1:62-1393(-)
MAAFFFFCQCQEGEEPRESAVQVQACDAERPAAVVSGQRAPSEKGSKEAIVPAPLVEPPVEVAGGTDIDKDSDLSTAASTVALHESRTEAILPPQVEASSDCADLGDELVASAQPETVSAEWPKALDEGAKASADGAKEALTKRLSRAKAKAKVKAKAKAKESPKASRQSRRKSVEYDEVGRRKDRLAAATAPEDSSSSDDLSDDDYCPSSKKDREFERELRKLKKKTREGMTLEQKEEMDNPWLHTQISEQERELKKNMFKSFYQEQYARLKKKAQPDMKQYESIPSSNLKATGGHRPMPRPKGVKTPKDFRKDVGRLTPRDLQKKHNCKCPRMLVSVYGDLFDVSDRPDKYGPDGPYWYMTGHDITWGLVSGEDSEENMDKFYDIFKIQPKEAADKRLQGLMSWWAFYEKEYGKPVGRNTGFDKEWGLSPPPNVGDQCSVM